MKCLSPFKVNDNQIKKQFSSDILVLKNKNLSYNCYSVVQKIVFIYIRKSESFLIKLEQTYRSTGYASKLVLCFYSDLLIHNINHTSAQCELSNTYLLNAVNLYLYYNRPYTGQYSKCRYLTSEMSTYIYLIYVQCTACTIYMVLRE